MAKSKAPTPEFTRGLTLLKNALAEHKKTPNKNLVIMAYNKALRFGVHPDDLTADELSALKECANS